MIVCGAVRWTCNVRGAWDVNAEAGGEGSQSRLSEEILKWLGWFILLTSLLQEHEKDRRDELGREAFQKAAPGEGVPVSSALSGASWKVKESGIRKRTWLLMVTVGDFFLGLKAKPERSEYLGWSHLWLSKQIVKNHQSSVTAHYQTKHCHLPREVSVPDPKKECRTGSVVNRSQHFGRLG